MSGGVATLAGAAWLVCRGPPLEKFFLPALGGPLRLPALVVSLFMMFRCRSRHSRKVVVSILNISKAAPDYLAQKNHTARKSCGRLDSATALLG